jgi:hypothetical protein
VQGYNASMLRRTLFPLFACALVAAAVLTHVGRGGDATADSKDAYAGPRAVTAATASSLTARAATAAKAFTASLTSEQKASLQNAFNSSKKQTGWSNLPTSLVARNGVQVGKLSTASKAKLKALLKTILSTQGYGTEEATRKADSYLNEQQSSGGSSTTAAPGSTTAPGGTGMGGPPSGTAPGSTTAPGGTQGGGSMQLSYGEGLYWVAFYGTPSTSSKWTVQFGGHHLAIHMTFSGNTVSNTPYFVGVEPRGEFTYDGKAYNPMRTKAGALFGLAQSLTTAQKAKAKLSGSFDDVVVGPGSDGRFPTKQGVAVTSLSARQQKMVTTAIRTYLGDMPASASAKKLKLYESQYAQTKVSYSGTPDGRTQGGYVRLQGPRLWLEIATQPGVVLRNTHYHSIERDIKSDYGAGT